MRRLLPAILFIILCSCQKDLTEYREYAYGTYWMLEDIDGVPTKANIAPLYHFLDYNTFEVYIPEQDKDGNWYDTLHKDDSYYQIFDYEWLLNIKKSIQTPEQQEEEEESQQADNEEVTEEGGEESEEEDKPINTRFDQVWDIQKFTKSHLSFRLSYLSDCGNLLADTTQIHNYRKIDKRPSLVDSLLSGTWVAISKNGTECSEKMSIQFSDTGKYTITMPSGLEDDSTINKENEDGSYVLCGKFLRLGSMDNSLWGEPQKRVLTAWLIEFTTKDKVTNMRWENMEDGTILVFSK